MTARDLRQVLAGDGAVVVPGAGSPLEALLIEQAGFTAVYVSGYATAANVHGLPDVGLVGRSDVVENVARIANVTSLPLIVDADTGYGDAAAVAETVRRLEAAGASAVQIEDQVWPKRCGHMSGKQVEPLDVMLRKIDAALHSRRSADTLVVARTDALAPLGLDEAVARASRFAELGADIVFVDAPTSREDLAAIGQGVTGAHLMLNVSEGGVTPTLPLDDLGGLGFKIVLYPSTAVRVAAGAVKSYLTHLRTAGDTTRAPVQIPGLDELNDVLGLADLQRFEASVLDRAGDVEEQQ